MVKIVLLNGVGSSGKSSIAKALQSISIQPFLHVSMDSFLEMMPAKYLDHPDGLSFETNEGQDGISTTVITGKVAECVLSGMRRSVSVLANSGNNLIVDEVIFGKKNNGSSDPLAEYRDLLNHHSLHLVGVFAELAVLERRERNRGNRVIGLSRWQFNRVHDGMIYDFSVHTDNLSPLECAEQIKREFNL